MPNRPNPDNIEWEQSPPTDPNIQWRKPSGVERSFEERWYDELVSAENILGAGGGIAGGYFGGPPGAVLGAGSAGIVGRYIDRLYEEQRRPGPDDLPQIPEEDQENYIDLIKDLGMAGLEQGAYEWVGGKAAKYGFRLANIFGKKITGPMHKGAKTVVRTLGKYMKPPYIEKRMLPVLPAEATQGWLLDIAHNIAESGMFAGRTISDIYKVNRNKAIDFMIDETTNQIGRIATPEQIGLLFKGVVEGRLHARSAATKHLWNEIDDLMANQVVDMTAIKDVLKPYREAMIETAGELPTAFKQLINRAYKRPDEISWMSSRIFKSHLSRTLRTTAYELGKDDELVHVLNKLQNKLQGAMRETTEKVGGNAPNLWKEINTIYAEHSRPLNAKFIRGLFRQVKDSPEVITRKVFQKGNITGVRRTKDILGESSDAWKSLKRWHIEDIMKRARDSATGELRGGPFSKFWNEIGDDVLKEIYSPQEYGKLNRLAESVAFLSQRQAAGTGRVFIQLMQPGAMAGMVTGAALRDPKIFVTATGILVAPSLLAKMFVEPKYATILIRGLGTPRTSKYFMSNMLRVLQAGRKAHVEMAREKQ